MAAPEVIQTPDLLIRSQTLYARMPFNQLIASQIMTVKIRDVLAAKKGLKRLTWA